MKSNQDLVTEFYDDIASSYDSTDFSGLLQQSCKLYCAQITETLPEGPWNILDLAIGTGKAFEILMSAYPNANFTGNDASQGMIDYAQKRLPKPFNPICQTAQTIDQSIESESQDLILSNFLFSYVQHEIVLEKSFNALKPGGYLSIASTTAKHCRNYTHPFVRRMDQLLDISGQVEKTGVPTSHSQLLQNLQQQGFEITHARQFQPALSFHNFSDLKNYGYDSGWLASYMHRYAWIKLAIVAAITTFARVFVPSACPLNVNADISLILARKPL